MITPFLPTLNLSVDNALSLQQIVHQLITEINNIVEYINNTDDKTSDKIKVALSEYDMRLQKQLESIEDRLQSEIVKAKENCINYTDLKASEIYNEIDKVVNELDARIIDVDEKTDAYYDVLASEIDLLKDEISKIEILTTTAVSPLDGMSKSISDVVYDLNQHSLLCSSYNIQQMLEFWYADAEILNLQKGNVIPLMTTIEQALIKSDYTTPLTFFGNKPEQWQNGSWSVLSLITSSKGFIKQQRKYVEEIGTGERETRYITNCFSDIFDVDDPTYAGNLQFFNTTSVINKTLFSSEAVRKERLMKARDMGLLNDDYTIKESGVYPL